MHESTRSACSVRHDSSQALRNRLFAGILSDAGYTTGNFPDGSVIVYDLLETKDLAGKTTEGATRRVDVMVKRSDLYRTTGGWEFMSFPSGDPTAAKLTIERQAACSACQTQRKDRDFVFSEFRK
jgi:hypothetical protein